ncbi:MAG: type II secretion system protein GspD [Candidatus Hinthialibacter sp.]
MMNTRIPYLTPILIFFGFFLFAAGSAEAQFRTGFGTTGRTGSSSNVYQREYLSNSMIGEAIIEPDYDSRSIIVITDEQTNEHIQEIIKSLDRPVQQVLIKVVFMEVTYRDDLDIGLEGSINADDGGANNGVFQTAFGLAAETQGGFYRLLENDLEITLRAISEKGKAEILSRPSILTRNNQEAAITVGQEVPFVRNIQVSEEGRSTSDVEYEDIGIILQVTPFITQDGLVELMLAPEISSISEDTVKISEGIEGQIINKRSADTVVVTPNGKTVVIGGMMEDNNAETITKVPLLGDIPLLGMAFRRTVKNNTKTELLIFLTPYVVEGPVNLLELSKSEQEQSEMIPKSFTESQLDKYLQRIEKKEALPPAESSSDTETIEIPADPAPVQENKSSDTMIKRNNKGRPIRGF